MLHAKQHLLDSGDSAREPRIAMTVLGEGPLVVFLHGIGGNRSNWTEALGAVAAQGFCAVAWDARGYGDSDDYPGPFRFEDVSNDLLRLLDHFGGSAAHLVGLSMGGRIAQDFYFREPSRVLSLCLCDTTPGFDALSDDEKRDYVERRRAPLLAGKSTADIAETVIDKLRGPGATPEVLTRLRASVAALRKESYIKAVEATVAQAEIGALEDITVPCHVIVGSHDRLTSPQVAQDMAARIPGCGITVIDGAGHLSNLENVGAFNAAVIAFLHGQAR
jgi:3-oxoadipate enol-lactonase